MSSSKIGPLIRKYREAQDLTQEELGDKVGVSRISVRGWENGERNPKRPNIEAVALALDAPLDELLTAANLLPQDVEGLTHILDPEEAEMVKYLRGMPPELRPSAVNAVKSLKTAGDVMRERSAARTLGKRADRDDNPSIRESNEEGASDDAITFDD